MTFLSKAGFEAKHNSSGAGNFPNNSTRAIGSANWRILSKDIADSFVHKDDLTSGSLLKAVVTIPTAEVLTSNASPVQILASPGVGKYLNVISIFSSMDFNSIAYASNVSHRFYIGANQLTSTNSGLLGATTDVVLVSTVSSGVIEIDGPMFFETAVGNPTAGNSDIKVVVYYSIEEI